jgi:hypothetical protein
MILSFYEELKRVYSNRVTIIYEHINDESLYLHSIISTRRREGNADEALNDFLEEFKTKNVYVFSSSELGFDKAILDKWYEKLGFMEAKNSNQIPYNITHVKRAIKKAF